jgi:FkbM family methyltransferase
MRSMLKQVALFVVANILPRWAYPVLRGPLRGARFILGALAGEGGGSKVYLSMIEPEKTKTFINILKRGQVCFDVGANVGYFSILGSRCVGSTGTVISFEPAVRNLMYLYRHVRINKAENVNIISAACSDSLSLTSFSSGKNCAEGHIVGTMTSELDAREYVSHVPTVTIDAVAKHLELYPDVLKIDVEGAELSVLRGADATIRKAKPKILVEVHSEELLASCTAFLGDLKYKVEPVCPGMELPADFLAEYVGA